MKFGPLHVVTQRTMSIMLGLMKQLQQRHDLVAEKLRWERERATIDLTFSDFLHPLHSPRLAPGFMCEPDADDDRAREAVRRVMSAYERATRDFVRPAAGLWDEVESYQSNFIAALNAGDHDSVAGYLREMFRTDLLWGLGYLAAASTADLRDHPYSSGVQVRISDMLVGLAEAVGVARVTEPIQDPHRHAHALDVDLDALLPAVEGASGLDLGCPQVGGAYGCVIGGKRVSIDSVYHGYTAHRLKQLGARPGDSVAEIGGGFGCLALLARRAGLVDYAIYDLPWVNALQGYFLIMSLPEGSVRLYGESEGDLRVMPGWLFRDLPDRSIDWAVNVNSMPEIGRETALGYLRDVGRTVGRSFLSINTEAKVPIPGYGEQNCVAELAAEAGGLCRVSRQRFWMRPGYVEEVYHPVA